MDDRMSAGSLTCLVSGTLGAEALKEISIITCPRLNPAVLCQRALWRTGIKLLADVSVALVSKV